MCPFLLPIPQMKWREYPLAPAYEIVLESLAIQTVFEYPKISFADLEISLCTAISKSVMKMLDKPWSSTDPWDAAADTSLSWKMIISLFLIL